MRSIDILPSAFLTYALQTSRRGTAERVYVLEVGAERTTNDYVTKWDGVKVALTDHDSEAVRIVPKLLGGSRSWHAAQRRPEEVVGYEPDTRTVIPAHIKSTWVVEVERRAAKRERMQRFADLRAKQEADYLARRVERRNALLGIGVDPGDANPRSAYQIPLALRDQKYLRSEQEREAFAVIWHLAGRLGATRAPDGK